MAKLLILTVSAGAGHVRASQAVAAAAKLANPAAEVEVLDVMDCVSAGFRKLYTDSYIKLVETLPLAWAYLYQATDARNRASPFDRMRRGIEQVKTRRLYERIDAAAPDAILCTHFLPVELLSRRIRKGYPTPPVWVQVTDFDVHGLWVHPHMSGYCVANEEVAFRLAERGIPREAIHVTGIPIMPQFAAAPERAACAAELGLDPARRTLLLMSGGAGIGDTDLLAERLMRLQQVEQLVVLAGRNARLLEKLTALAARHPGRLMPMGFTTTVERIMRCADLAVTKPGGLSTSECLTMQLPMVLVSPIPGQEERNADYLLESGCAMKAIDAATLEFKVARLMAAPEAMARMREAARCIATPHAARDVLQLIFGRA